IGARGTTKCRNFDISKSPVHACYAGVYRLQRRSPTLRTSPWLIRAASSLWMVFSLQSFITAAISLIERLFRLRTRSRIKDILSDCPLFCPFVLLSFRLSGGPGGGRKKRPAGWGGGGGGSPPPKKRGRGGCRGPAARRPPRTRAPIPGH